MEMQWMIDGLAAAGPPRAAPGAPAGAPSGGGSIQHPSQGYPPTVFSNPSQFGTCSMAAGGIICVLIECVPLYRTSFRFQASMG